MASSPAARLSVSVSVPKRGEGFHSNPSTRTASPSSARSSACSMGSPAIASAKRLDPFSQRKQQLAALVKYINHLLSKLDPAETDEYIDELKDALTKIGFPPGPSILSAEDRVLCEYFRDIEGHDPEKLKSHMEDLTAIILKNPSAAERDNKRDRLTNGFTNVKTAVERKQIARNLDGDTSSDMAKYRSLVQLFDINYFSSNSFYELAGATAESRLNEASRKVKEMKQKERRELLEQRNKELTRARTAKLYFSKARDVGSSATSSVSAPPIGMSLGSSSSESASSPGGAVASPRMDRSLRLPSI